MATRTIVTSQPDVECDVCERRLLRGEQPDVFIGAGRRRLVCELCAPRAAHEGWLRETDSQPPALPPARPRRGRSLFERLSVAFKARDATAADPAGGAGESAQLSPYDAFADPASAAPAPLAPYEQAASAAAAWPSATGEAVMPVPAEAPLAAFAGPPGSAPSETPADAASHPRYLGEALEVFNASPFPRRVAGVIRSLGAPLVNVRSAEHLASVVRIVVAWELCWYRYEVDLSELEAVAEVIAQGSELAELPREDRVPNASAADGGSLVLARP
ncbi:MAG TPA: hypothetical protein VGY13_00070 [Solirubrobacteraceae bacterium]|jgi:hypothetical protein|nr:hypothetical protein [Solirubrobacteraceae bacterium]